MTRVVQNLEDARVAYDEQSGSFWVNAPKQPGFPEGYHERVTDVSTQFALMGEAISKGLTERVDIDADVKFANEPFRVPLGMNLVNGRPVYVNCPMGSYSPLITLTGSPGSGKTSLLMNFMVHGFKHQQTTFYCTDHPTERNGTPPTVRNCETVTEAFQNAVSLHESDPDSGLIWVVLDGDHMWDNEAYQLVRASRTWRSRYPRIKIAWATQLPDSQNNRTIIENSYLIVMGRELYSGTRRMLGVSESECLPLKDVPFSGLAGNTPFVPRDVPLSARDLFSLWKETN